MRSNPTTAFLRRFLEPLIWIAVAVGLIMVAARTEDETLTLFALVLAAPALIVTVDAVMRALEDRVDAAFGVIEDEGAIITLKGPGGSRHAVMAEIVQLRALPGTRPRLLLIQRDAPGLEVALTPENTERLAHALGRLPGFSAKDVFTLSETGVTSEMIVWERVLG